MQGQSLEELDLGWLVQQICSGCYFTCLPYGRELITVLSPIKQTAHKIKIN